MPNSVKRSVKRWMAVVPVLVLLPVATASVGAASSDVPLIEAAKSADAAAVRALLEQEPGSVTATEPDGTTALHYAVHRNDLDTVETLLAAGARVDAVTRYGVRPLTLAAENGDAAVVGRLLAAGADPNGSQPGGETALMTAARTGDAETIRTLIAHGAGVAAREETRSQTPLMWAAVNGNAAAITALVAAGADVHARSTTPEKPNRARRSSQYQVDEDATPDWHDPAMPYGSLTALAFAARRGHIEAVGALLDAGANVNDAAVVMDGEPPTPVLTLAIANAHYELAAYLLDRGADPNLADNGWTALHQLARARSEPAKQRTNVGWTVGPTMTGKISGLDLARKLVEAGADVNSRATREFNDFYRLASYVSRIEATPLLMAARVSDAPLMRLLLELGADPRLPAADGMTPLMATAGNGIRSPMEDGIDVDAPEALQVMLDALDAGVDDVNVADARGWTPLHGAAYRGSLPIIRILVDYGARLDAKTFEAGRRYTDLGLDESGWLPVHVADGIVVGGIFFRQVPAAALLRELMTEQGLPVPVDEGLLRGTYQADETTEQRLLKDGRTRGSYFGKKLLREDAEPESKDPETPTTEKQ